MVMARIHPIMAAFSWSLTAAVDPAAYYESAFLQRSTNRSEIAPGTSVLIRAAGKKHPQVPAES
jgi:hypothetical protein